MKYLYSIVLLFSCLHLFAQPANDDCANSLNINIGDCSIYNNVGANQNVSTVNFAPIGLSCNPTDREVWFEFTTPASPTSLQLTVTGITDGVNPAMVQPRITFIRGAACTIFEAADCADAPLGSNTVQLNIDAASFIPNFTYYILVSDWSSTAGTNEGSFEICLEEYVPPADICADSPSTISDCTGTIYDSGGDSGNYSSNENCVFTITPSTFNQCIVATINFYDLENFSDFLNFYDGTSTAAPQVQSLTGTGANIEVQVASGSLTIEFISDGSIENAGFELSWECTTDECTILAPIDVNTNVTVDDLVDALSSPQVLVENPILNCPDGAYGSYTSPGNTQLEVMGLPNGVILSTGNVEDIENNEAFFASTILGAPGDADLDSISLNDADLTNNALSNDACILEFDVYAATDELEFQYVFGSEEYPGFVGTAFNDIFAFLISGPGLADNTNIAVLEDDITEVSINTVNDGSVAGFGGPTDPATGDIIYNNNAGGLSLPYGGYTTVLTASAEVIPCNYYHLKLAIADRSDSSYDSGVFIGDLSAGLPQINLDFSISTVNGENILVEGCSDGSDIINATIENPNPDTFIYYLGLSGTADENLDLVDAIPDSLVALPGTTTFSIPFEPTNDGIAEGIDTLIIDLFAVFQCDTVTYNSIPILIYDETDIETSQDTFFVCSGTSVQLGVSGATDYTWGWPIPSEIDNPNLSEPTLTPSQSGTIFVSGIVNGNTNCIDMDSSYIQIIDPTIAITSPAPFICEGESTQLLSTSNTNNIGITWSPATGLSCIDCANPIATPNQTIIYTATVTAGGCSESTEVLVTVDPFTSPDLIADTQICEGSSIQLSTIATGTGSAVTTHQWTPDDSLDDGTSSTPNATPVTTTTYTVISNSLNGVCTDTQSVTIEVFPATIDILGPDTIYQCNNALNSVILEATSIADPNTIVWTDDSGISIGNGPTIQVSPNETATYTATISIGACVNSDEVTIQIDSLPLFNLDVSIPTQSINVTNPDTIDICAAIGESIFVTNLYNGTLYPEINHEWLANGLPIIPAQNGANMVDDLPSSITTYSLYTNNNACTSIDSFVVDVNTPPDFIVTPSDTTICSGESVQLVASGSNDFTWTPNDGTLSGTDINNPIATPNQTTEYVASTDNNGCQVGISSIITVLETPFITVSDDLTICNNSQTTLGIEEYNQNFTYNWSPTNSIVSGGTTGNPTVAPNTNTTYSVTVTNGICEIYETVTINLASELPILLSGNLNICFGENVMLNAITQGAVFWSDDMGNVIGNGAFIDFMPPGVGIFNYSVTAVSNECTNTQPFTITVNETPNLSVNDAEICLNEIANINATTDTGTILWTPEEEFTDPSAPNQSVSPNATTSYIVIADNNGCIAEDEVIVTVLPSPIFNLIDNSTICNGESISLGDITDPNTTYNWTPTTTLDNPNSGNPVASPTTTTTYNLIASNGDCVANESVTISIAETGFTVNEPTICPGEEATLIATLTGDPGGEFNWIDWQNNVVGTGDTFQTSPSSTTSYTVTYVVDNCVTSIIATVNVLPVNNVSINATPSTEILAGEEVILTPSGIPSGSTFEWQNNLGEIISNSEIVTVTPSETTTYTLNGLSPEGCPFTSQITIFVSYVELEIPNVFTPNADEMNDSFYPVYNNFAIEIIEFKIFDRWGELVHEDISSPWDGRLNGKELPSDIYVWFIKIKYADGTEEIKKGDIALLR